MLLVVNWVWILLVAPSIYDNSVGVKVEPLTIKLLFQVCVPVQVLLFVNIPPPILFICCCIVEFVLIPSNCDNSNGDIVNPFVNILLFKLILLLNIVSPLNVVKALLRAIPVIKYF